MKFCQLLFFVTLVSILTVGASGQGQSTFRFRKETIRVLDTASGFESTVLLQSVPVNNSRNYFIYYTSLEKITGYEIRYFSEKGKWKLSRKSDVRDIQAMGDEFYTCDRSLAIELPGKFPFQVNYEIKSTALLLQSNLLFYDRFPIDTFYYEIHIPEAYHLRTQLVYPENLQYFRIDSTLVRKGMIYSIVAVPRERERKVIVQEPNNIREHRCMLLTAIVPREFSGEETRYFNDWMLKRVQSKTLLNGPSRNLIDSISKGIAEKDSIICSLFDFVRDHIKYISVEIGYGAFIPHDVNQTLVTRQGDCKDMASLLCEALRYKGVNAWIAVASTATHNNDMNFPSLAAGNHQICVTERNGKPLFLDPTNKSGTCWLTAEAIQGRTVLILNDKGGTYAFVPPDEPEVNRERITIELMLNGDILTGTLQYAACGSAMQHLRAHFGYTPKSEWAAISRNFLSELMAGTTVTSAAIRLLPDTLIIDATITLSPSVLTKNGKGSYLSLGFLPFPMEFINGNDINGDIIIGHTVLRESDIRLKTGNQLHAISMKPVQYDQNGFQYRVTARNDGEELIIKSVFRCQNVVVTQDQLADYRKFSSFVTTAHNYAITFK